MPQLYPVAKISEFVDLKPVYIKPRQSITIAVYKFKDRYFAYLNWCPHQGGPACEGITIGEAKAEILPDGKVRNYLSTEEYNIACPWHGVEFDLETGICRANHVDILRAYEVIVENDEVKVKI